MKSHTPIRKPKIEIETKVFCILSDERAFRSKSPDMFSAALKHVGIKGVYVPFMVHPGHIGEAVRSLKILNIAGANVTVPYKESVMPYLDVLSEGANIIGSINTICRDGEMLKGYNTNAIGFMDTLSDADFDPAGKSALVFGTGGAARAMVFMLNWLHASPIFITGRSEEKIKKIVNRIGGTSIPPDALSDKPIHANIVVNATSVSGSDEAPELAELVKKMDLRECEWVIDLNYGRPQSFWKDMAETRGIRFTDGLPILANQAKRSFALWTGLKVEASEFLKALDVHTDKEC